MDYTPALVIAAVIFACVVSARLSYLIACRQELGYTTGFWFCALSVAATALMTSILASSVIASAGYLAGLLLALVSAPLSGFIHVLVLGSSRVFDRLFKNFLNHI